MLEVSAKQSSDWQRIVDDLAQKLAICKDERSDSDHQFNIAIFKIKDDAQIIKELEVKLGYQEAAIESKDVECRKLQLELVSLRQHKDRAKLNSVSQQQEEAS